MSKKNLLLGLLVFLFTLISTSSAYAVKKIPFYRSYSSSTGDHFYTSDYAEHQRALSLYGYRDQGIVGYISPIPIPGLTPLYRAWSPNTGDHIYSLNYWEIQRNVSLYGYWDEGIAGYVSARSLAGTAPLHRTYNPTTGDHYYTTSVAERDSSINVYGYVPEGYTGFLWTSANEVSPLFPLYRAYNPHNGDHFYTIVHSEYQANIQKYGYVGEGIEGYILKFPQPGAVALYRLWNPNIGDHFYTTSWDERIRAITVFGYKDEAIIGFISPNHTAGSTPLYRLWNYSNYEHMYTVSAAERDYVIANNNYKSEGITGYIWSTSDRINPPRFTKPGVPGFTSGPTWKDQGANTGDGQKISFSVSMPSMATEVYVECSGGGCSNFGWTSSTSFTDTNVHDSQTVKYRVKSRNQYGVSDFSGWKSVSIGDRTPPGKPVKPTLKWIDEGVNSGDGQSVEVKQSSVPTGVLVEFDCVKGSPCYDTGTFKDGDGNGSVSYITPYKLLDSQKYQYRSRFWDTSGNYSSWSDVGEVDIGDRTPPEKPATPTLVWNKGPANSGDTQSVTVTQGSMPIGVTVQFQAVKGNPSYDRAKSSDASYTTPSKVEDAQEYKYRSRYWDSSGNYSSWSNNGAVTIGDRTAPVAKFTLPTGAKEADTLTFDGTASYDYDQINKVNTSVDQYNWTWGDGNTSVNGGSKPTHTYSNDGTYKVTLKVYDSEKNFQETSLNLSVANVAPTISVVAPNGGEIVSGTKSSITWSADDVADSLTVDLYYTIDGSAYFTIATGVANDESLAPGVTGSYLWDTTLAGGDSDRYKIVAVANDDDTQTTDDSDGFFTVDNNALVITPQAPVPALINTGYQETTDLSYILSEPATVTVSVFDNAGVWVKDLASGSYEAGGVNYYTWDGTDSLGNILTAGKYYFEVIGVEGSGNTVIANSQAVGLITLNAQKPVIEGLSDSLDPFSPDSGQSTTISYNLFTKDNPAKFASLQVNIDIVDGAGNLVKTLFNGVENGSSTGTAYSHVWDGTDGAGFLTGPGVYSYTVTAQRTAKGGSAAIKTANPKTGGVAVTSSIDSATASSGDGVVSVAYRPASVNFTFNNNLAIPTSISYALFSNNFYLVSPIYDVTPDAPIVPPAVMTFKFNAPVYGGSVGLFHFNETTGVWEEITSAVVDEAKGEIRGEVTSFSLYAVFFKGPDKSVIEADVQVKGEALNGSSGGVLTVFVNLPEPYGVDSIVEVLCEGADSRSMAIDEETGELVVKFNVDDVTDALAAIGDSLDEEFVITGELEDGTRFMGTDFVKKVIDNGSSPASSTRGGKKK